MAASYQLPPLPYAYNALEPHIDEHTMKLHHDKHHLSVVGSLNRALEQVAAARMAGDFDGAAVWSRQVALYGAAHVLHSIFWTNMAPPGVGGGEPGGGLADQLALDFGSITAFREQFGAAALSIEGGGWAVLGWEPVGERLLVLPVEKYHNGVLWGLVPLLVLDMWEHAYYLTYRNRRGSYVEAWWKVVNWSDVGERWLCVQR